MTSLSMSDYVEVLGRLDQGEIIKHLMCLRRLQKSYDTLDDWRSSDVERQQALRTILRLSMMMSLPAFTATVNQS
jgi:hypothetical protein